jgi:hypothetical protein
VRNKGCLHPVSFAVRLTSDHLFFITELDLMKRRIFVYFFSAILIALVGFTSFDRSIAQTSTFQHYTDAAGFQAIQKDQLILSDTKGRVFLTPNEYSQGEAFYALFIGISDYKNKGSHVFKLRGCLKSLVKKLPKLYTVYEKSKYHETKQWEYKENHILQI